MVSLEARRTFDFEDVRLVVPPTVAIVREAPRALEGRGLDNVVAFTRLLGHVRYFHPSDEALRVNWDEFTVRGLRAVERAPTADSLARTLRALFAPTVPARRTIRGVAAGRDEVLDRAVDVVTGVRVVH